MLIKIFKHLEFEDHLSCRAVCKSWYELITTQPSFRSSCCLVLANCVLSHKCAPTTSLLTSNTPFKKLVIEHGVVVDSDDDLTDLWTKLGKTVTCLDIQNFNGEPWTYFLNALPHFRKLKELKLKSDVELVNFLYVDLDWMSVDYGRRVSIVEEIFARLQCGGDLRSLIPRGYLYLDSFNITTINDIIDENIELIEGLIIKHIGGDIVDVSPFMKPNDVLVNEVWDKIQKKLIRARREYPIQTSIESMQFLYMESQNGDALDMIKSKFPNLRVIGAEVSMECNDEFLQYLERSKNLTLTNIPRLPLRNHTQIGELTRLLELSNVQLNAVEIGEGDILDVVLKRQKDVTATTLIHSNLPESYVNCITRLCLRLSSVQVKQLRRFEHFTTLKDLTVIFHDVQGDELDSFSNLSLKSLEIYFVTHMCSEWLQTFILAFRSLISLSLRCNGINADFIPSVLENYSKLKELTVGRNLESQSNPKFVAGIVNWKDFVPKLKTLTLDVPRIVDSDEDLEQFFTINKQIRKLNLHLDKSRSGLKTYDIIIKSLPHLKQLKFTVQNPTDWPSSFEIIPNTPKTLQELVITCIDFSNEVKVAKESRKAEILISGRLEKIFEELPSLRYIKIEKPALQLSRGEILYKTKSYSNILALIFNFFNTH